MGVNISSFRLGEIVMGLSAILLVIGLIHDLVNFNKLKKNFKLVTILCVIILLHFIFQLFYYGYSFFDLYPFKASSYIWVLGFFYLGKKNYFDFSSSIFLVFLFISLIVSYFSSIFGIDETSQLKILNYTDKFDYLKASDLLIFFLFFTFFLLKNNNLKYENKIIFLVLVGLYFLPLLVHKSRGSSIAFLIALILLIRKFMFIEKSIKFKSIIIFSGFLLLVISSFIVTKSELKISEIDSKLIQISTSRYEINAQEHSDYPLFYFRDLRLFSSDGDLNWRFQIWQDVISDLYESGNIINGYGYNNKIPAMNDILRSGNDGTNENVHNFLINILARGGIIHLILFLVLYFVLLKEFKENRSLYYYLLLVLPVVFTSLFDSSMENSHFPLLFYYLLGNLSEYNTENSLS